MAIRPMSTSRLSVKRSIFNDEPGLPHLAQQVTTDNPFTPGHWSQSLVIRLMIGLVVTIAVTVLLLRITDLVLFWFMPNEAFWNSVPGFVVWQGLELIGVFVGALLCVAGRAQMITLGMLLGMVVGFLTLILLPTNHDIPSGLYFAMPAWFTAVSCLGAWLGEKLWHPQFRRSLRVITNARLTQEQQDISISLLIRQAVLGMIFANIRWLKVILAVLIILPTLWYTHDVVDWVILKTGLLPWVREVGLQKTWVEFMIKIMVVVLCGAMVGAGTNHGIAHGFWTGVICGVLNLLLHVFFPREGDLQVDAILWEVGWVFLVCIISGGFGAMVIPPIMYLAQRRRPASLR